MPPLPPHGMILNAGTSLAFTFIFIGWVHFLVLLAIQYHAEFATQKAVQ
jgi:hypothetical protein